MRQAGWKLAVLVVLAAACALAAPGAASEGQAASARKLAAAASLERGILAEVNALRRRHGLAPLRANARLAAAAASQSRAMAVHGFFGHDSVDGSDFGRRVARFYGADGYRFWSVGENLVWASPDLAAGRAVKMWLDSPPHRRNLLSTTWREIGLSAVRVGAAPGIYEGLDVVIVTANFGARR